MQLNKKGFTLIEILIVVAIIGVLASIVLVGLGPAQKQGRDARRLSDIRQVQTGLELYFQKCGYYPGDVQATSPCSVPRVDDDTWAGLSTALVGSIPGIPAIPNDPIRSRWSSPLEAYQYASDGISYILAATLEGSNTALDTDLEGTQQGIDCNDPVYCVQF